MAYDKVVDILGGAEAQKQTSIEIINSTGDMKEEASRLQQQISVYKI